MARSFAFGQNYLECAIGAMSGQDGGDFTVAFICRLDNARSGVLELRTSGGTVIVAINADDGFYWITASNFASTVAAATADNWHLVAITKATGNSTPRGHKYVYDTNTWTHSDAGNAVNDNGSTPGSSGVIRLGRYSTGDADNFRGDVAAMAMWNRVLTDAEIEQLAFSLAHWHAADPDAGWLFDQSATSQNVLDFTGGGANQTGVTGTVGVSTNSVALFGYGADVVVPHSVPAAGQSVAIGRVTETDTARTLTANRSAALGQVTDTGTARALARSKSLALGQVAEAATAQALGRSKAVTIGQVTEADTARPLGRGKSLAVGQATEADTARPLGRAKTTAIGRVTEIDTAQTITTGAGTAVGQVAEADSARVLTGSKTKTIGQAAEADTARPLGRGKSLAVGQPTEADTARTLGRAKTTAIGRVTETDTALSLTARHVITLGQAAEADTARPFARSKAVAIGRVTETDTARTLATTEPTGLVGAVVGRPAGVGAVAAAPTRSLIGGVTP